MILLHTVNPLKSPNIMATTAERIWISNVKMLLSNDVTSAQHAELPVKSWESTLVTKQLTKLIIALTSVIIFPINESTQLAVDGKFMSRAFVITFTSPATICMRRLKQPLTLQIAEIRFVKVLRFKLVTCDTWL